MASDKPDKQAGAAAIRIAAMNLLARREHSRSELADKLTRRFPDSPSIEQQLDQLQADGLQSDQRFTQAFINSRIGRLQGPLKIRQELNRFGLEDGLVSHTFEALSTDWLELALEAARRKFGAKNLTPPRERDRARQFLYRRGFDSETCVRAIDQLRRTPS